MMHDDIVPEDGLLRPLYDASPPPELWNRVALGTAEPAQRHRLWRVANPWRGRRRPLAGALTMSVVLGVVGLTLGLRGLTSGQSDVGSGTRLTSTSCDPGAGLETPAPSDFSSSAAGSGASTGNPDAGLSDAQRDALHKQAWSVFQQRYAAWVQSMKTENIDLHALPRQVVGGTPLPGQASLRDAVAKADVIVVGCISAIRPMATSGTETTVSVEQTLKGSVGSDVLVDQTGGLFPTPDYKSAVIGQGAESLLLPGDRAILLLQKSTTSSDYTIQNISGWYQVVAGVVHGISSWSTTTVNGKTEADFVQRIKDAEAAS
jgi:hypothetical protein